MAGAAVKLVVSALLVSVAVGVSSGAAGAVLEPAPLVARIHVAFFAGMDDVVTEDGGWMTECWAAVTELRSCTNEIVLFFVNGESYLGRECCVAIRTVTRHCWPSMLSSVGFTAEEADVLRGFCDAEVHSTPPPPVTPLTPPPAPPAPTPAPAPSTGDG